MLAPNFQPEITKSTEPRHLEEDAHHTARLAGLLGLQAKKARLAASSIAEIPTPGDDIVLASMVARVSRAVDAMEGLA